MTVGRDGPVCPQTDLPRAWCGHCRPPTQPMPAVSGITEPMPAVHHGPTFTAEYHGTCSVCGEHIAPGDTIARLQGTGYACEECLS